MKYKNICSLIYNVGACMLGVFTTKPPSSAMARGLSFEAMAIRWSQGLEPNVYPVPLLT